MQSRLLSSWPSKTCFYSLRKRLGLVLRPVECMARVAVALTVQLTSDTPLAYHLS